MILIYLKVAMLLKVVKLRAQNIEHGIDSKFPSLVVTRVHILMAIYQFLYQKDTSKTSIFQILLLKLISPDESGDQYTYVGPGLLYTNFMRSLRR